MPSVTVTGVVTSTDGYPVGGASIYLSESTTAPDTTAQQPVGASDLNGQFSFSYTTSDVNPAGKIWSIGAHFKPKDTDYVGVTQHTVDGDPVNGYTMKNVAVTVNYTTTSDPNPSTGCPSGQYADKTWGCTTPCADDFYRNSQTGKCVHHNCPDCASQGYITPAQCTCPTTTTPPPQSPPPSCPNPLMSVQTWVIGVSALVAGIGIGRELLGKKKR